ncbi:membrane integrity-associated transporter subunit PqiC [Achromobacter sp. Marseille-Q0513]|uniref:ABC-type transport auxiliary lipoprotein family protein n=1 Tax=Achromobacter sp. Marseille-Q0513 TaxID=2829161 RepID=UPI001B9112D7|nr:ABC-type transport auxiliary lipoprotein family protein [Achromobacter sp. Marseille-Q0513]MBR8655634.1 membrane integrity-associated transporter subunit PqiC [Achromobacter sp. Marseille-Q0513]
MKMRSAFLVLTLVLAGCGVGRVGTPPSVFDLGADLRPALQLPARAPIALAYTSVPALSDTGIIWRVGDSAAPKSYATYRWASSPSDLVRQRLTERLSRQGPVLGERVNGQTPQLQVQLQQFEQVFAPDGASSQGRVVLQAVLVNGHKVLGQTRIAVQAPAPTQDAAGGVAALRQATDDAADQLAQWLATALPSAG